MSGYYGITYSCGRGYPEEIRMTVCHTHHLCAGCECLCHRED